MPSLRHPFAHATINVTSRTVAFTSARRSASTLSFTTLPSGCGELTIPKICDIFDAPARLRESRECPLRSKAISHTSSTSAAAHSNTSKGIYSEAMELPWTLPPPIIFDGPARPPHMSQLALEKHRRLRQHTAQSTRNVFKSATSFKTLASPSETIREIFDCPSRIARYKYTLLPPGGTFCPYIWMSLFVASAYGWFAYENQHDSYQRRQVWNCVDIVANPFGCISHYHYINS
ncbi:hypothetical protein F5I97DRAFT_165094 [Phlebopus sp. FC_14]|nr:hypothetical protein F5I97DRAFT_165094 [Phlebopus sp. FC_14]